MKELLVYTDGSCINNGTNYAKGGIGIYFPNGELKNLSKSYKLGVCTNQKTELYAILTALRYIKQNLDIKKYNIIVKTDSQYSINCITKWIYLWKKNNWMTKNGTPVINREMIELINKYYEKYNIEFIHVDAHTHLDDFDSISNEYADKLANMGTKKLMQPKRNPDIDSFVVELVKN